MLKMAAQQRQYSRLSFQYPLSADSLKPSLFLLFLRNLLYSYYVFISCPPASTWKNFFNNIPASSHHSYQYLTPHVLFSMEGGVNLRICTTPAQAISLILSWNQPFRRTLNSDMLSDMWSVSMEKSVHCSAVSVTRRICQFNSTAKYQGGHGGHISLDLQSCNFYLHLSNSYLLSGSNVRSEYELCFLVSQLPQTSMSLTSTYVPMTLIHIFIWFL